MTLVISFTVKDLVLHTINSQVLLIFKKGKVLIILAIQQTDQQRILNYTRIYEDKNNKQFNMMGLIGYLNINLWLSVKDKRIMSCSPQNVRNYFHLGSKVETKKK